MDEKQIVFALSFMNDGDAGSYKEQLLEEAFSKTPFTLGTWRSFVEHLKEAFLPYDGPGDALEEMKMIRMKDNSIEDHNARFKMLVSKSRLDKESPVVVDYYRETLNIPLQQRILSLENLLKKLDDWYEWVSRLDNNWRRTQRIMARSRETYNNNNGNVKKKEEPRRRFNFTRKDPNAMDVDALSIDK